MGHSRYGHQAMKQARVGGLEIVHNRIMLILPDDTADWIGAAIDGETLRRK